MRKLLYALAAVAVIAPLAAFGTANAAPAHPAAAAAPAVVPLNLPATKCFQITDGETGNYGSVWFADPAMVTSHTYHTPWCPYGPMADGSQILIDPTNHIVAGQDDVMGLDSSNQVTEFAETQSGGCDIHEVQAGLTANPYCEWTESLNTKTGLWTITNNGNQKLLTGTSSGADVKVGGSGDTQWKITCLRYC
jgi:hypothetical protein